jgi:hypothetical protein
MEFYGDYIEFVYSFCSMVILAIFILPIHEYEMSFHLLVASTISFFSTLYFSLNTFIIFGYVYT